MKSKPVAVLISDIHFNLKTREVAGAALRMALIEAEKHNVPLILGGDTHDTKAILRGECIKTIVSILKNAKVPVKVLVGNHDKIHEKSNEHALEFLRPYVDLIDSTRVMDAHFRETIGFIPYQSTNEAFLEELSQFRKGSLVICHQGFKGAYMGEYTKDDSSVDCKKVEDYRIISGHYHRHQNIGTVTYIGTPYTITFAEANDGPKGYVILNSDRSIEQVPINLRRHVIMERTIENLYDKMFESTLKEDLIWLKVRGPSVELDKINKRNVGIKIIGHQNFKLDKISTDVENVELDTSNLTDEQILDGMIEQENETQHNKEFFKALWRELLK